MTGAATAVEAHVQRLDAEDLAAFVADLWAARGFETTREDDVVVATRGEESLRIAPVAQSRWQVLPWFGGSRRADMPSVDADVVVAPRGGADVSMPSDARLLDAADLRKMLRYALDEETRDRLCSRHFGGPPATLDTPGSPLAGILARLGGVRPRVPRASASVAAVLLVVVGFGAVAGVVFTGGAPDGAVETTDTTPADVPTVTTTTSGESFPPGISEEGIANLTALAAAHERILAGRSYMLWLDSYRPKSPNASRVQRDVDIAVAAERYLLEATLVEGTERVPVRTVYYDGEGWTVAEPRHGRTAYFRVAGDRPPPLQVPGPFALRRSLVTRYLSTPETQLVGQVTEEGRRLYRIEGSGQPAGLEQAVREYDVTALVDRRGLVHSISVSYTLADSTATTIRFEATYGRFGNVTVSPPPWYDRPGENATGAPLGRPVPPSTKPVTATSSPASDQVPPRHQQSDPYGRLAGYGSTVSTGPARASRRRR